MTSENIEGYWSLHDFENFQLRLIFSRQLLLFFFYFCYFQYCYTFALYIILLFISPTQYAHLLKPLTPLNINLRISNNYSCINTFFSNNFAHTLLSSKIRRRIEKLSHISSWLQLVYWQLSPLQIHRIIIFIPVCFSEYVVGKTIDQNTGSSK